MNRYYLDHAATSWPKAPGVLEAYAHYQTTLGAASGRGSYRSALEADGIVQSTRGQVARLIGCKRPTDVAFCQNGTFALNSAIMGIALKAAVALGSPKGSPLHVVTTATEHNSVLRPLSLASGRGWLTWSLVGCDRNGLVDLSEVAKEIRPETKWLMVNHASNVTGTVQPLWKWRELADKHRLHLLVDAAQSLGYLPIDVDDLQIDILAAPGHKGLGGPLGTGVLYVRKEVQEMLSPLWVGGTGMSSHDIAGPFGWEESVESGNQNVPALAALLAALAWKEVNPLPDFQAWMEQILEAIATCDRLRLVGPPIGNLADRLPVISIAPSEAAGSAGLSETATICQEWSMMLESLVQVECRAGFHCAGKIHSFLDTEKTGGTLRLSLGATTTQEDVDAACRGIELLRTL